LVTGQILSKQGVRDGQTHNIGLGLKKGGQMLVSFYAQLHLYTYPVQYQEIIVLLRYIEYLIHRVLLLGEAHENQSR